MSTRVGLVGLGLLGHAVASRLVAAGHEVVGYDVLPERVRALEALGGVRAASPEAVARSAALVCTILPSLATVEMAVLGPRGVLVGGHPEQPLVQMSTISPALTERLAAEADARGLAFLDCPVSGTSAMVAQGEGVFFVGGELAVLERSRPVLEAILPRVLHVGGVGHATVVKLAANLLVGVHTIAAAEALGLAQRAGLDPGRVLEALAQSAGTSRMLELRGPMMVRGEFPPQMKLELFLKDLGLMLDAGARVGAPLPLTTLAHQLYEGARSEGHGGADLAVVAKTLGVAGDHGADRGR